MKTCSKCGKTKPLEAFRTRQGRCKPCHNASNVEYAKKHRAERAAYQRAWHSALRLSVIAAYGGSCVCCGEAEVVFLTIDHIRDDGNVHRRTMRNHQIWAEIKREGYPSQYQVLCFNCNWAKSRGGCPHGTPAGQPGGGA